MKKKLRIHSILLGGIMMLLTVFNSYAQDVIDIVSWRFSSPATTAGVDQENTWLSTVTDLRVEPSELIKGPGIIDGSVVRSFGGTSDSWHADDNPITTRNERDYFEFKIKGKEGYLSLSSIDFKVRRATQAANTYRWAYKLNDEGFKDIGLEDAVVQGAAGGDGVEQPTVILSNIADLKNLTPSDEVIIRLYIWGTTVNTASGVFALGRYGTSSTTPSLILKGIITETPLPVSLIDFTAKPQENNVKLDWSTASEIDNSHFEILRSGNGERFDVIGTVAGKGTTSALSRYSFTDFNPLPGTSYYRLRQIDFNGDYAESDIRAVNISLRQASLSIATSKEEPLITLFIYAESNANAEFFLTNTEGKKVVQSSLILSEGENKLSLPVHLAKGVYIARLISSNINRSVKFMRE